MNRIDLFKRTVDTLYHAHTNDKLHYQKCCSCAVGNMISESGSYERRSWYEALYLYRNTGDICGNRPFYNLGYAYDEIDMIERAFESERCNNSGLKGLLNVIECLGKIHDAPKETVECLKDSIKNRTYTFASEEFIKKLQTT